VLLVDVLFRGTFRSRSVKIYWWLGTLLVSNVLGLSQSLVLFSWAKVLTLVLRDVLAICRVRFVIQILGLQPLCSESLYQ